MLKWLEYEHAYKTEKGLVVMGLLNFLISSNESSSSHKLSVDDALDRYLALKSGATQRSYKAIINEFRARTQHKFVNDYTERECLAWGTWALNQRGMKGRHGTGQQITKATVLRKAIIIRGWLALAGQQKTPMDQVVERLKGAETGEKRATQVLTATQVRALLEAPSPNSLSGIKDRAFIACLFGGALRISEVLNIKLRNVQKDRQAHFIELERTKAGKRAEQVLPAWAADRVEVFVKLRERDGASPDDFLFLNKKKKQMSQRDARNYFRSLLEDAGISADDFSPHSARATAITQLLTSGVDYNTARTFARHASFNMVARYDKRYRSRETAPGTLLKY